MSQTYKATGINLKSVPLGEADRILTILTREYGLIRAAAPGARKPKAKLGGRSEMFVVNQLLLARGRSLDRITQADSLESYPRLSRDLAKLTVGQYWAEVVLAQTLEPEPNPALFDLLCVRLADLANSDPGIPVLIHLVYGITQLLALEGILPQIQYCCLTHQPLHPESIGNGRVVLSPDAGGLVLMPPPALDRSPPDPGQDFPLHLLREPALPEHAGEPPARNRVRKTLTLTPAELGLIQHLFQVQHATMADQTLPPALLELVQVAPDWLKIEQVLRGYLQHHTERTIRSAVLLESCVSSYSVAV